MTVAEPRYTPMSQMDVATMLAESDDPNSHDHELLFEVTDVVQTLLNLGCRPVTVAMAIIDLFINETTVDAKEATR